MRSIVCSILLSLILYNNAYCNDKTPEQFIYEFYQWYLDTDSIDTPAEQHDEIYTYVSKDLVDRIRKEMLDFNLNVSYFTKVGEFPFGPEKIQITVHKSLKMRNNLFIAHVTLCKKIDAENFTYDVIVILKKIKDRFYISSVIDVYPDIFEEIAQ